MFSPAWAIFPRCRMTDCACKFITATCCFVMNFNPTPPRGVGLLYLSASPTRRKSSASPTARSMFSPAWAIFPRCRMTDCINSPAQILRGAVFLPQASANRCELPQNILQLVILRLNSTIRILLKHKKAPDGCFFLRIIIIRLLQPLLREHFCGRSLHRFCRMLLPCIPRRRE